MVAEYETEVLTSQTEGKVTIKKINEQNTSQNKLKKDEPS